MRTLMLMGLSVAWLPVLAFGDVAGAVNDVRMHGCADAPGGAAPLRANPRLDVAARRLSRGESLDTATAHAGYRALNSASVQITNVPDDRDIQRIVGQQFCARVSSHGLREIGTYRRGSDIWLIVAEPFATPAATDHAAVAHRVLELTNRARAQARLCGATSFAAAPPLVLASRLERPALEHSQDMAAHDEMSHTGHDGSSPDERVTRSGYRWRAVGENLASGITSAEQVVSGWVSSPHHCANLMSPKFSQMAVAYAVNPASRGGIFWTQLFAAPERFPDPAGLH